jgi:hypothetical protein
MRASLSSGDCFLARSKYEDGLIEFFKKPWWVGPLVACVSIGHHAATNKPATPSSAANGYEVVNNHGTLPRNGKVVVVATCPAGKHAIGGGYVVPSPADTTDSSGRDGINAWRASFKSNGGGGIASVYAICVATN